MAALPSDPIDVLLRAMGDLAVELTPAGEYVRALGATDMLAAPGADASGKSIREFLPPDVVEGMLQAMDGVARDGVVRSFEYELPAAVSGPRQREARIAPAGNGNFFVIVRDISARKRAEGELRESEALFRIMADHSPVMLWRSGKDALCFFFNRGWLQFTGRTMAEEMGNGWAEGVHPEDFQNCMDVYLSAFVARKDFRMEYRLRRHDGEYRWLLDTGTAHFGPDGAFEGYIGSCVDITDHKQSEAALTESLQEKDMLLKEVHHRVKNNLQVISSLLELQADYGGDAKLVARLQESRDRVRSMALIHERLYQTEDLSRLDFKPYMESLLAMLASAHSSSSAGVRAVLEIDDTAFDMDHAVPLGLIANELIANCYKHAFAGRESGRLRIRLVARAGGGSVFSVEDNGCGLPEGFDPARANTLGLKLVRMLAGQLGASIRNERNGGVKWVLEFQAPN